MNTGIASHVDFDCIFEKGKNLPIPEKVPFRLTRNLLDICGVLREKGTFQKTCEAVLAALRRNRKNILGFLSSFVHDPIIEKTNITTDPEVALRVIKDKISGLSYYSDSTMSVQAQVKTIIAQATNDDYLREM